MALADKTLAREVKRHLVSLHPSLDLVAITTHRNQVEVFRFSGSRAFGIKGPPGSSVVTALCWKSDGSDLCIVWDYEYTQFVSASNTGQGWSSTPADLIESSNSEERTARQLAVFSSSHKVEHGLPEELSFLAASPTPWTELPPLEPYPTEPIKMPRNFPKSLSFIDNNFSQAKSPEVFSRTTVDNDLNISIDSARLKIEVGSEITELSHNTNRNCINVHTDHDLRIIHLNTISHNGTFFRRMMRSVSALNNLAWYVANGIHIMDSAWKDGRQPLDRRLESIASADLSARPPPEIRERDHPWTLKIRIVPSEKGIDLTTALKQLALAGICSNALKEWITEEMGTQGILRWYNVLGGHLRRILDTCHQNVLPALERTLVEACSLRALSRRKSRPICQVDPKLIEALINDIEVLRTVGYAVIRHVSDEAHQVFIFGDWLLSQHQRLHDPGSASAKDAEKKIAETDYPQLLAYIDGGLMQSRLNVFFGRDLAKVERAPRRANKMWPRQEVVEAMLKRHDNTPLQPVAEAVEYVNLPYLSLFLRDTCLALDDFVQDACRKDIEVEIRPLPEKVERKDYGEMHFVEEVGGRVLLLNEAGTRYQVVESEA